MTKEESKSNNLSNNLKCLSEITKWFDNQEEADIEEGLKKVKEAVGLIRDSKRQLKNIENEFEKIKKEIDIDEENGGKTLNTQEEGFKDDEIPW